MKRTSAHQLVESTEEEDDGAFFQVGRDFESVFVNHKYTKAEQEKLAQTESIEYLPPTSRVFKIHAEEESHHHHGEHPERDRWIMMGIIGISVGFVGFVLHNLIDKIEDGKWDHVKNLSRVQASHDHLGTAWAWVAGYSLIFVIFAASINAYLWPAAIGSGIPETIAYLNGAKVTHAFNFKTLVVKFLSCAAAVGSGLPVGPEGPMIHMGAMIGAGLSQMRSTTVGLDIPFLRRFRNFRDKRDFISAGAGAGVSSAFGAPVGGLLFAMEEVASFWNQKLGWQIFFCCMLSTTVTSLFNSSFSGFEYLGGFGLFREKSSILFEVVAGIPNNVLMFIPAIILGIIGGLLGTTFTFFNLKIAKWRKRVVAPYKWRRVVEPCVIMLIYATFTIAVPHWLSCSVSNCETNPNFAGVYNTSSGNYSEVSQGGHPCLWTIRHPLSKKEPEVSVYGCFASTEAEHGHKTSAPEGGVYSQSATLFWGSGDDVIKHMFSRGTYKEFELPALFIMFFVYFPLACWAAGATVSSGLVVPMLLIGSLYGRIFGVLMIDIFGVHPASNEEWIDPGVFALIGAASFFGGVSRLTMSLTVIMVEITQEVRLLLPIMVAIMVSKWVADYSTHSLYHAQIEAKCIPFLDFNVHVHNMELFTAKDVAAPNVVTLKEHNSVKDIAEKLQQSRHNAFPVLRDTGQSTGTFHGLISRGVLQVLLSNEHIYTTEKDLKEHRHPPLLKYKEVTEFDFKFQVDAKGHGQNVVETILQNTGEAYDNKLLDLGPYVNISATQVQEQYSLDRTYLLFRTLGLRHLTVTDANNCVTGMITRKDLMGFKMEEKIEEAVERRQRASVVGNSTDRADSLASLPQVPNPAMDGGSIQTGSSFEAGSSDNFGAGNPAYSDQAS